MADDAHIVVKAAYQPTGQVCDVFHLDTPTQGQLLATRLVERLPRVPPPKSPA